jgi:hypothetical protein
MGAAQTLMTISKVIDNAPDVSSLQVGDYFPMVRDGLLNEMPASLFESLPGAADNSEQLDDADPSGHADRSMLWDCFGAGSVHVGPEL